jgi:hypothetical protein
MTLEKKKQYSVSLTVALFTLCVSIRFPQAPFLSPTIVVVLYFQITTSFYHLVKLCFYSSCILHNNINRIVGVIVIVSVLTSSAVDRGFESRLGQPKDYKMTMCCFSFNYAALRRKSKDWLTRNQDNLSEWRDMSFRGLF